LVGWLVGGAYRAWRRSCCGSRRTGWRSRCPRWRGGTSRVSHHGSHVVSARLGCLARGDTVIYKSNIRII
jgi:hypothetical protein